MDPMQAMKMMQLGGGAFGGKSGGTGDMGMKILQAALNQNKQLPQPQAGQVMPGGATNIVPPQPGGLMGMMGQGGGMGLLSKLLGGLGGAGAMGGAAGGATGGLGGLY